MPSRYKLHCWQDQCKIERNVAYVDDAPAAKQALDMYLPAAAGAGRKVVVHFHGGGFITGDCTFAGTPDTCRNFARCGYIAIAPSYHQRKWEHHRADAIAAVSWAVKNITRFGGDPAQVHLKL